MEAWLSRLGDGDGPAAWGLFEERYRRLILATIRRLLHDQDEVMEVYAIVCASLAANEFERLRRYSERSPSGAAVSTWLVIVVRNLAVDWLRKTRGRRRVSAIPVEVSGLQREIYIALCLDELPRVEAFEHVRTRLGLSLSFPEFLREVRQLRQTYPCPESLPARPSQPQSVPEPVAP